MTDRLRDGAIETEEWRCDFESARDHLLDAALATTAAQRLKWLEEALQFAHKVGALRREE
jgi:hypothetical protein